jgi:hypothetical protein
MKAVADAVDEFLSIVVRAGLSNLVQQSAECFVQCVPCHPFGGHLFDNTVDAPRVVGSIPRRANSVIGCGHCVTLAVDQPV